MTFRLHFYPSAEDEIEQSRGRVLAEVKTFAAEYRAKHHRLSEDDHIFLQELELRKYWGVLNMLDGVPQKAWEDLLNPTKREPRSERQSWARHTFSKSDLQKLLDISVNLAFLVPDHDSPFPGTYMGHTILYAQLAESGESMFADVVSPDFRRKLNNGRFWESLPYIELSSGREAYPVVFDVLQNHFTELDTSFCPEGIQLARRRGLKHASIDIRLFPDQAVKRYGEFFKKVDTVQRDVFEDDEFGRLVAPFVLEMIATKDDHGIQVPRFLDTSEQFKTFFEDDFVRRSVIKSKYVQARLAEDVALKWGYSDEPERATDVFLALPNPAEIGTRIFERKESHEVLRLLERIEEWSVRSVLDDDTNAVIAAVKNKQAREQKNRQKRK